MYIPHRNYAPRFKTLPSPHERDRSIGDLSKCNNPHFTVIEPIIDKLQFERRKYLGRIFEIQTSILQRPFTLSVIIFDLHSQPLRFGANAFERRQVV
jgi:hypothetical protein